MQGLQAVVQPHLGALRTLPSLAAAPLFRTSSLVSLRAFTAQPRRLQHTFAASAAVLDAPGTAAAVESSSGFAALGLGPELVTAVTQQGLTTPTEIQAAAASEILGGGGDVLLASHTGSGKTLAYLLPLIKLLKDQEKADGAAARPKRPRALVLGPTRELTDQILAVAKKLSHHARFRSACVNGGGSTAQQKAALERPLDLLVGTPQKIAQHAAAGNLFYGDVQLLVLDEADTMFDAGFGPEVQALLRPLRSKPAPARVVLVLATLRKDVERLLAKEFPQLRHVRTSSLHKGVASARHTFLPIPPLGNKLDYLSQVVGADQVKARRVMVFCNTLDSCIAADHFLRERGIATLCYHGDVPLDGRREAIREFSAADDDSVRPVLVCTDLAARGLDMAARVDHVVNFDFPLSPIDFIHRAGRTARAGARGRVTSLVTKRDRVLAARIEDALENDRPLDALSAAKSVVPPHMRPKEETLERRRQEKKAEQHSRRGLRGAARLGLTPGNQPTTGGGKLKFAGLAAANARQEQAGGKRPGGRPAAGGRAGSRPAGGQLGRRRPQKSRSTK